MAYNEITQRGSADFPFAYFYLDQNHPKYNMAAHWHSEIELLRVLGGEFEATLNNNSYTVKKGDILFMNSETVHKGIAHKCIYECIVFHADYLYVEAFDTHSFVKSLVDGEYNICEYFPHGKSEVNAALNNIFEAVSDISEDRKLRVIASFYNFFATVFSSNMYKSNIGKNIEESDKKILKLKNILSYLRKNYSQPISLTELSQTVGLSPQYLSSFFKSMTGKTPIEYLTEYRIEKAAHKLRSTDLSITDIAFSCGFSDLSYFIKVFKNTKGISPGKYRNL